ncbi:hypothetical protein C6P40_000067 [Pichia californica]|uniref:Bromo domain-containing protein n=1 Tax=Pichia californica TaxID=460514 RepID=A0A9P6WPP1_9ASCO|nr:hypothetical protein C6P42_000976 [[Candida] californica]KAG0691020.1 hypothetical protein C6P40_000067 [[Candida] californica]
MHSEQFRNSLDSLFYVYSQLDGLTILDTLFPNKDTFYEDKVQNINYSFLKFLDANPQLDESLKTSINSKFNLKSYNSIYDIFHDIKLSCILKILEFEDNPKIYIKIDQFYKISVELLLREALRLGISFKNSLNNIENNELNNEFNNNNNNDDSLVNKNELFSMESRLKLIESTDSLEKNLEKDFDIITSSFFNNTGKSLSIFASGDIPFFSSLNNLQSDLDDREPIIDPSFGITINNVIPNISMINDENLSKFSNQDSKIPNIKQILENYMHPNWLRLISSQWLKHGNGLTNLNFSFAPTYDETQSIISNDWKGLTWCQQIGFKKLIDIKENYDSIINNSKIDSIEVENKKEIVIENENLSENSSENVSEDSKENELEEKNVINNKVDIKNDDLKNHDAKNHDTKNHDMKNDDAKNHDIKNDDIKNDDAKNDDAKNDDAKNDDAKNDDAKNDDAKNDDAKNDDAKNDDAKNDSQVTNNGSSQDNHESTNKDNKVDLANVLQFNPNGIVTEDEVKAVKSNNVQNTISDLLNELGQLRQDRIERQKNHARYNKNILGTGSRIFKPSSDETKLYFKIQRLLTGLIDAKGINPNQLNIDIDKRIPVLQHTYQGTLPSSPAITNQKTTKTKRKR